ncbi:MAG TPA: alpha/beta fold hydrolase, partial [Actinomycetota bacterium]|nr:alpha/beta fold hydrolase [Actinomycetota bacterium]
MAASAEGDRGGDDAGDPILRAAANPRLARHRLTVDGRQVGVAVGGHGLPLVLASGLLLTDRLYVQTLSRLAGAGFRVVAVDVAGSGISDNGKGLDEYGRLLGRVLDELGVERAVLAGHSLGGRLVTELAARRPERVVALLLVDASVGAPWDNLVRLVGWAPPSVGVLGAMLLADTLGTVPFARDLHQAAKLSRLAVPVVLGHLSAPWRLFGPGLSALYAAASAPLLDRVARTA